jgi:hypothetical protein
VREKAGLVKPSEVITAGVDGDDRAAAAPAARTGVVWTPDGFRLVRRIAGRAVPAGNAVAAAAARTSQLALAAVGPAAAPRAATPVPATADGINGFLQDLLDRAEARPAAGREAAMDRLRGRVGSLQLCMVEDPQARPPRRALCARELPAASCASTAPWNLCFISLVGVPQRRPPRGVSPPPPVCVSVRQRRQSGPCSSSLRLRGRVRGPDWTGKGAVWGAKGRGRGEDMEGEFRSVSVL